MSGGQPNPIRRSIWSGRELPPTPDPIYATWDDYLARTTPRERMRWCAAKAKVANRVRLVSGRPETRISADDVWAVLDAARGRCCHCGSLAVERRPSNPTTGAPTLWEHVGRRVGSLEHLDQRCGGGANAHANLAWACLWCNTLPEQRIPGAIDRGGHHPLAAGQTASDDAFGVFAG